MNTYIYIITEMNKETRKETTYEIFKIGRKRDARNEKSYTLFIILLEYSIFMNTAKPFGHENLILD
jgi:hypothetical protein